MDMVSYIISLRLMPNGIYRDHKRNGVVVQNEPLDRYSFLNVTCRINYIITNVCGIITQQLSTKGCMLHNGCVHYIAQHMEVIAI